MSKSLMKVDVDGVVNQVKFHPSAEHVMVTSTNKSVALIDVVKGLFIKSYFAYFQGKSFLVTKWMLLDVLFH